MTSTEENTLARVIADLEELDQLHAELELTTYQASDPDYAEKFRLLAKIAELLRPLAEPLTGLASRQAVLATPARLDDLPSVERATFHGDWPIVQIARIRGCERFDALVYILDGGYALARQIHLNSSEVGLELVFHLSDETTQCFYSHNQSGDAPEGRLTLEELRAILNALPLGLIRLSQLLDRTKAELRVAIEEAANAVGPTGVR